MAQHARPSIADNGWRLPRDWRKSVMSEKTSMSRWGCVIMAVDLDERVLGHRGCAGQAKPHVDQNPFAQFIAICRRSKWSKHVTNSPFLALLAMAGSKAACKISSVCSNAFRSRKFPRN